MKYIESPMLAQLSALLSHVDCGDRVVLGRLELFGFSCSKTAEERKLSDHLVKRELSSDNQLSPVYKAALSPLFTGQAGPAALKSLQASPKFFSLPASPMLGPNGQPLLLPAAAAAAAQQQASSREVLVKLISTLNASFPDYDFSSLTPEQFTLEVDAKAVESQVSYNLGIYLDRVRPGFSQALWKAIGSVVDLSSCEVYSLCRDEWCDEEEEGTTGPQGSSSGHLFATDFFFYDKKQRRVLLLACETRSKLAAGSSDSADDEMCEEFDLDNAGSHRASRATTGRGSSGPSDAEYVDEKEAYQEHGYQEAYEDYMDEDMGCAE